jgi:hypothetical protein
LRIHAKPPYAYGPEEIVLQGYFAAATRRFKVRPEIARRKVELFARLNLVQIDLGLILAAIEWKPI